MKSFKKVALVFALVVMGACLFAGGSSESSSSYKIGFIGPMTGDNANYGILCSQSVKLAVDQANKAGGINGTQIELIIEDSEGNQEKGMAAIEKLSSTDKISCLVGPVFTGVSFVFLEALKR